VTEAFACRGCGSVHTSVVLDLGDVPASDFFPAHDDPEPDPRWPLRLVMCADCALVQLGPADHPDPEPPTAVESATALAHAAASARDVVAVEGLRPGDRVIEIDSHHGGSWLGGFTEAGLVPVDRLETADLVVDVHGIAHEPQLDGPIAAHAARLAPGGRLVLEFHHLLPLVEQCQIDTVRHGHWVYLSLTCIQRLFRRHGLTVTRAIAEPVFGGSLRVTAARTEDDPTVDESVGRILAAERAAGIDSLEALMSLGERGRKVARELHDHLSAAEGRSVAGYGAPSKAAVLLSLAGIDASLLPYTVDLAPAKAGSRIPGVAVPVFPVAELYSRRPAEIVVLTWDIAEEVVSQLRRDAASDWDPDIFVPLPDPRYIAGPRSRA
jgi:hypothetical protein